MNSSTRNEIYGPVNICRIEPSFKEILCKIINNRLGTLYGNLYTIDTIFGIVTISQIINIPSKDIKTMIWDGIIRNKLNNKSICEINITKTINDINNKTTTKLNIIEHSNQLSNTYEIPIFCIGSICDKLIDFIEEYIVKENITIPLSATNLDIYKKNDLNINYDDFEDIESIEDNTNF